MEIDVSRAYDDARRLETLLYRTTGLMRRLFGNEDLDAAIFKVQRLIMIIRMAHTAMIAFEAASGPIGYALALVGIASAAMSAGEFVMELG